MQFQTWWRSGVLVLRNRKPMNRGIGFKKPELMSKPERTLTPIRQDVRHGQSATLPVETPKHSYVRSPALMRLYGTIPCQVYGCHVLETCGAHSNWGWGKGRGIKADDNRCASMCMAHHHEIDQGHRMSDDEKRRIWFSAHVRTVQLLVADNKWPIGIAIPNLDYPEDWP